MAKIYKATNKNQLEVDEYVNKKVAEQRIIAERKGKNRPLKLLFVFLFALGIIGALYYIFSNPDILNSVTVWVKDRLTKLGDMILEWFSVEYPEFRDDLISDVLKFLFYLLVSALGLILWGIVALLAWSSPALIVLLIIGISAFVLYLLFGYVCFIGLKNPSDRALRKYVFKNELDEKTNTLIGGIEGEEKALNLISHMSNDCHVFANLDIWLDGKHNETDLIVVSPSGLTMIEVKNYSGTIEGDFSQPTLIQIKHGRKRASDPKESSNPVFQIDAPAKKLAEYLRRKGISVTVRRCALFINNNVTLNASDLNGRLRSCPVFTANSSDFHTYLHASNKRVFNNQEIAAIVAALMPLVK